MIWSNDLVKRSGQTIWSNDMVKGSGQRLWSKPVISGAGRSSSSPSDAGSQRRLAALPNVKKAWENWGRLNTCKSAAPPPAFRIDPAPGLIRALRGPGSQPRPENPQTKGRPGRPDRARARLGARGGAGGRGGARGGARIVPGDRILRAARSLPRGGRIRAPARRGQGRPFPDGLSVLATHTGARARSRHLECLGRWPDRAGPGLGHAAQAQHAGPAAGPHGPWPARPGRQSPARSGPTPGTSCREKRFRERRVGSYSGYSGLLVILVCWLFWFVGYSELTSRGGRQ